MVCGKIEWHDPLNIRIKLQSSAISKNAVSPYII
jgi:hypothetical protein